MNLETFTFVLGAMALIFAVIGVLMYVRNSLLVGNLEIRLKELRQELNKEYADGGITRERISAEGKVIQVWRLVKSEKIVSIENEIRVVLADIYRIDPGRGGKLAMLLIAGKGL